jgi:putative Mg2+ transporter-C (MgtC) family protein
MLTTLTGWDVGLRVLLTVVAAAALGYDRRVEGRPASVRSTLLVALAACFAMIQANWLLNTVGKQPTSFIVLDLMRLPLGILTGVGFIGGGAILKRGDSVSGLTTAATLWFVTVVGLCFGCGQLWLGGGGAVLGYGILHGTFRSESRSCTAPCGA